MNPLKLNFRRNTKMEEEYCIVQCGKVSDNDHLVWCQFINKETDYKYIDILSGNLLEKVQTLKQIQRNEKIRKEKGIRISKVTL